MAGLQQGGLPWSLAAGSRAASSRHTSGMLMRPPCLLREEATSSRATGSPEVCGPPRRGSLRPLAYLQSSSRARSGDAAELASSSPALLPPSPPQPPGSALAITPPAQEQGGGSLVQLVAAWDQLAARLPPSVASGRGQDVILAALKLALAYAPPAQPAAAAAAAPPLLSRPLARALSLAARLADLAAAGLPIDAESIAAGILAEVLAGAPHSQGPAWGPRRQGGGGAPPEPLTLRLVEERVGPIVAQLAHDIQRARQLPARVELLDDTAASALRELCLSFYDVRATAVEVVARLDGLCGGAGGLPGHEQQVLALEALQMYAPMGHALGLSAVSAQLEDRCFQILFPESYLRTAAWLREQAAANADAVARCSAALEAAVRRQPRFGEMAAGVAVAGRTKTLFSTLKKLLRLGNTAQGGRARAQLYDLVGLRAVVQPRTDLPPEEAEELAAQACYLVRDAACQLWRPVPGRCKDYIAAPKSNGYQSLHSTVRVPSEVVSLSLDGEGSGEAVRRHAHLELQIRTQAMHERAERGEAAHGAYKGGLDAAQALQLRSVTESVLRRTASAAAAPVEMRGGGALRGGDAAAEGLFRHLDQNGDGRISLEELQFALQELGVEEAGEQSRAAAELLQLAAADGGEAGDGTIGFEAFMAFQRRVGLLQALSCVDHQQAHALQEQQQAPQELDAAQAPGSLGSFDGGGLGSYGARRRRLAAGACSARTRGGSLAGRPLGGGLPRFRRLLARSFVEASSACSSSGSSSSSSSSVDEACSGSTGGAVASASSSTGDEVHDGAIAPQGHHSASNGSSSSSNGNGSSSSSSSSSNGNGSISNGTGGNGAGEGPAERAAAPSKDDSLLRKPRRDEALVAAAEAEAATKAAAQALSAAERDQQGWAASRVAHGILGLAGRPGPPPATAAWQLVSMPTTAYRVQTAAGAPVPAVAGGPQVLQLPDTGLCIMGAVLDRDCDYVLDAPTVSGRHAQLQVVRTHRRRGPGSSRLVLTDLGSTNGTGVNRRMVRPGRHVNLQPGDVLFLAGRRDMAFEVQVMPREAADGGVAGGDGEAAAAAAPAVGAALRLAGALEAAAAQRGRFPPAGVAPADAPDRARQLMAAGAHDEAHALLLAAAMQQPWEGGLWAQLANLERNRARRGAPGSNHGLARGFYAAAAAALQALPAGEERSEGLARALGSWAQLELALGHTEAGRELFRGAVDAARAHPAAGEGAAAAARQLFTWAQREWKAGEALQAQRLCLEAVEAEPGNAYALTLLGNLEAAARRPSAARRLFDRALKAHPGFVAALQSWGRLEGEQGRFAIARGLFSEALEQEPENAHVLQAWAVAEAKAGAVGQARDLLRRCTELDPCNRAAWHAWGHLEEGQGRLDEARRLYGHVLRLKPSSVPALSALGRLERRTGRLAQAQELLEAALEADPQHAPSVRELSLLAEEQGDGERARQLHMRMRYLNAVQRAGINKVAEAAHRLPAKLRLGDPPQP